MPERVNLWGIPHWGESFVFTAMGLSVLVLLFRFFQRASLWWRVGRPETRWDQLPVRLSRLITYALVFFLGGAARRVRECGDM